MNKENHETIADIVAEIRAEVGEYLTSIGPSELPSETQVEEFADRFVAAHERELAEKNAMIAEQSAVNEAQAAQLRDALNECEELKCAIADSKRISDAVVKSLRDKNLEMAGEIAAKDAEIVRLRALVKEMADALECAICGLSNKVVTYGETYRLVAKAREVVQ